MSASGDINVMVSTALQPPFCGSVPEVRSICQQRLDSRDGGSEPKIKGRPERSYEKSSEQDGLEESSAVGTARL